MDIQESRSAVCFFYNRHIKSAGLQCNRCNQYSFSLQNPANSITPALADSVVPTFYWNAYPQTKEYIIEVRDINGNLIWGGFTASGEIRHAQIPKEWNSVEFNFDGSALMQLQQGNIYQWRLYSDDEATAGVQTLLSSSEDLMGLFITP